MIPVWEIGIILVIAILLHLFLNSVVDALASKVKGHPIKKAALEALKKPLPLYLWLVAIVITTNAFSQRFLDYPLIPDSKMWLKATFLAFLCLVFI